MKHVIIIETLDEPDHETSSYTKREFEHVITTTVEALAEFLSPNSVVLTRFYADSAVNATLDLYGMSRESIAKDYKPEI